MRVGPHMSRTDVKCEVPVNLSENEWRRWAYQRYIKDYLRVVAAVDDNVGRVLDCLDAEGLTEQGMTEGEATGMLEQARTTVRRRLERLRRYADETLETLEKRDAEVDAAFNPYWGSSFAERHDASDIS